MSISGATYSFYIYKKDTACFHNICYYRFYEGGSVYTYLREDTTCGKIYRYYPNIDSEYVWCDMSLNVGDTFYLPIINDRLYLYPEQGTQLVVDSIAYINGKKIIYFPYIEVSEMWRNEYLFRDKTIVKLSFIEGIGSTYGPMGYDPLGGGYGLSFLLCVHINDSLEFIANANAGCDINYVSIEEKNIPQYIRIHPNPTKGMIEIKSNNLNIKQIELFDIFGKLLLEKKSSESTITLDISPYAKGMYLLRYTLSDDTQQTKKIIKE
ncbi:MAG: T9SS type A sorting domain-containing protein [Bacteroidales bacterium]|nr:T9SS type A sorting domain-containing protein [Bacteroidales bacterium]